MDAEAAKAADRDTAVEMGMLEGEAERGQMSGALMMLRRPEHRMQRRSTWKSGDASRGRAEQEAVKMSGMTSGGAAMKEEKEPKDLVVKKGDWEDYVSGIGEDTITDMTEVLMIEGVNGHKGVTMLKGHLLAADVTEAKGPMNIGDPATTVNAANANLGQELELKGEKKTADNGGIGMNI